MTTCGVRYKNLATGQWRRCVKPDGHRDRCDGPVDEPIPAWQRDQLAVLLDACHGLDLGIDESRTLLWLSQWEPHTVENVAAVIRRAKAMQR